MRRFILMLPLLFSGCATETPGSLEALADETRQPRADHAAALAAVPDDLLASAPVARVVVTGANLIEKLDAGFAGVPR